MVDAVVTNNSRCRNRRLPRNRFPSRSSICEKFLGYKTTARIDIHCEIQAVPFAQLSQMQPGEPSAIIRERVIRARNIQTERFSSLSLGEGGGRGRIHCNAQMTERMLHQFAEPDAARLDILP